MNEAILKALAPMLSGMNFEKIFTEKAQDLKDLERELGSPIYLMVSVNEESQIQLTIYTTIEDILEPIKSYIVNDINQIITIFSTLKNTIDEFKNRKTSEGITDGTATTDTDSTDAGSTDTAVIE